MVKKLLTFLTLLTLFFGVGWAETAEVTFLPSHFSGQGTSGSGSNVSAIEGDITIASDKGYGDSGHLRVYSGGKLTISSTAGNIVNISITCTGTGNNNNGPGKLSGTGYTAGSGQIGLWQGTLATSVTLSATAQVRITKVTVTYETGGTTTTYSLMGTGDNGTVTFTVGGSAVTSAAAGATVTATATANTGYEFSSWTAPTNVSDWNANGNVATFTMPAAPVTVTANFTEQSTGDGYFITFGDNGTDATNATTATILKDEYTISGLNLVDSYEISNFVAKGETGLKFASNKNPGTLTINLSAAGQAINAQKVIVKAYGSNKTMNVTINNGTSVSKTVTSSYADYEFDANGTISTIAIHAAKENAIHVKSIEIVPAVAKNYDVTVTQAEGGTISASPVGEKVVDAGDKITVTATPDAGYELSGWAITGAQESEPDANNQITANGNVTITATFSKVELAINRVITTNGENSTAGGWLGNWQGCSTVDEATSATGYTVNALVGSTVSFKAGTNDTYQILDTNVTAVDGDNNSVSLTKVSSDGTGTVFSFTMPGTPVTISANFTNYRGDLRLAGHFNGNSTWRTGNSGPLFSYDSTNDKYTISAYFTGLDDGGANDYFFLTLDGAEKHPQADQGNYYIYELDGDAMPFNLSGGSNNNFGCAPGVYNIEINGALTSMKFTKVTPTISFSPAAGEVEQGTTVSATSNLTNMIAAIKAIDSNAGGEVTVGVNTDQGNTWNASETLNTVGSATVYGKAYIGNISATGNAAYTVVPVNTNNQYQRITSTSDLIAGKKYIIVSEKKEKAAGFLNSGGKYLDEASVSISNDIATVTSSDVQIFTLGGNSTDGWTFTSSSGIMGANSSKDIVFGDASATNVATISFGTQTLNDGTHNEALITFGANGHFIHNVNSTRFKTYTSDYNVSMVPVQLYKQVEGTVADVSATPSITPGNGNIVGYSQEVTMTQENGGTIYYTMTVGDAPNAEPADPADPTEASAQYNSENKPWAEVTGLGYKVKIKAVAKEDGKELSSPVIVTYQFVAPASPVFSPDGGTYTGPQSVTLTSNTTGADVYYTTTSGLNAAQIVAQGTKYTAPFTVSEQTTYYAVTVYHDVHANKDALSGIRQAQYKFSEVESVEIPYSRPFTDNSWGDGDEAFTINNDPSSLEVWTLDATYGAKGTSYINGTNYAATSWLISPWINMADAYNPTLTFNHTVNQYFLNPSTQATVWIRTYGGEWEQLQTQLPSTKPSGWIHFDEEYSLSNYSGLIQIGFKYYNSETNANQNKGAGTWEIKNFVVSSEEIATPEFNPAAGAYLNEDYPNGLSVELTCSDENVTIWYSTDGVNYSQYSSAINITETTTIYAYSMLDGHKSAVVTANYRLADYVVKDVVFSPASGTYYGDQTVQMFSTTKGARIYYTTDGSEPSMENGTLYTGEVSIAAGNTYNFKAIAYVGSEPSGVSSVTYVVEANAVSSYLLHNVNELNTHELDSEHDYQMVNPVQVIYMSTYQNNGYQPEYCLVRDNTGYGMIYFGKQNTYHNNFHIFNMGDWIKGGYSGPITCFNDPNKPGLSDTHPELGSSSRQSEQIHSWSSNLYMSNSPVLPEYLTIPEILASEDEGATDYWGHYVHLRKTTIQLLQSDDPGEYTTGQDKDGKWSGSITDEDGNVINYYDKFYLQYDKGWNLTNNDFTGHPNRTFDVYGFVSCYLYADVHYQISPFAFAWIDKPVFNKETATYYEPQTVTISSPEDPTATLWYKTDEMDDFAKYIPGTTVITVNSTTTIETYATKMSQYNDELESLHNTITLTFQEIPVPVISPESQVQPIGDEHYVDATIAFESGANVPQGAVILYTINGEDPKTSEEVFTYVVGETTLHFTTTTTVRAIAKVGKIYSAEAEPRTYTFVKSNGIEYTLITDEAQLNENSVYIIVNKANNMAMGNTQDANHRDAVGVAFKEGTNKAIVYGNDDVAQFTLHSVLASDHIWAFQTNNSNVNGYLYVGADEDNTLLTEGEQDTHGNAAAQVLINETGTDHAATIKFTYEGATDRYVRYYNRNQLFNTYRTITTSTEDVYIYGVNATPLATIEKEGVTDNQYTIADELIAVHCVSGIDEYAYLWCKDQGNVSIDKTEKKANQIDYMREVSHAQSADWDQSNWVVLKFKPTSDLLTSITGAVDHYLKPASITGTYTDDVNFTITMPEGEGLASGAMGDAVTYTPNVFSPANFLESNLTLTAESTGAQGNSPNTQDNYYFFMNPKIQEVATVTYAVWNGSNGFVIPKPQGNINAENLNGAFTVNWKYNNGTGSVPTLTTTDAYRFKAAVQRVGTGYGPHKAQVSGKEGVTPSENFIIYPLDLVVDANHIVTSIKDVADVTGKAVAGVKYYNLAGMESDRPFEGVNIIVTTYTDGSRSSAKVLK